MAKRKNSPATQPFIMSRTFDALRDLVFKVWTEREHLLHWWGPKGVKIVHCTNDLHPSGVMLYCMRLPDGKDIWGKWVYREIVKPERIVYKHGGEKDYEPVNFQATVTFAEQGGKTRLSMRMVFPSANARDHVTQTYGAVEGLTQTVNRLAEYLTKV